jgi:2-haloacid dehalogenase
MAISTLIFDLGNVVIGWDPRRVYRRFLDTDEEIDRFLVEIGFSAWNLEQDRGGRSWADAVAELSGRFPHHRELIHAYHERWADSITGPIEGTVRILQRLRDAGYHLVALTNWSAEKFLETRGRYDVFALFDDIVVSGEVGLVKPDREIFELAIRRIGRGVEECLFIDDSETNVAAASTLGFRTIRFVSPEQLEKALEKEGIMPSPRASRR